VPGTNTWETFIPLECSVESNGYLWAKQWSCFSDMVCVVGVHSISRLPSLSVCTVEDRLDHFATFKKLQRAKQGVTFRSYLNHMSDANIFKEIIPQEHSPGLKENIIPCSKVQEVYSTSVEAVGSVETI